MKQLSAFAICLLIAGTSFAQAPKKTTKVVLPPVTTLPQRDKRFHKNAVGGYFTDMRRRPVKGVKAYLYRADSTIAGSGFSDSSGYYETNSVPSGLYDLKIAYPSNKFSLVITGVPVLPAKISNISFLKADAPAADTTIAYTDIAPKPKEKPKGMKMAQHK